MRPRRARLPRWTRRSPLYALEAYGINDPWFRWRIAHNDFDEGQLDALMTTVHAEDLLDEDSRQVAARLGIMVESGRKRIDMRAPALA